MHYGLVSVEELTLDAIWLQQQRCLGNGGLSVKLSVASGLADYPENWNTPKHKCHAPRKEVNECI